MGNMLNRQSGYVRVNWPFVEEKMIQQQLTLKQLVEFGVGYKSLQRMKRGDRIQCKIAGRLAHAMELVSSDLPEFLRHRKAGFEGTVCFLEWASESAPTEWRTTSNGIQYRIHKLRHVHMANQYGRGKCFDLAQFDDAARERVVQALHRHPHVLYQLRHQPAFPVNAGVGFGDANYFWVVDCFEEGITLEQYVEQHRFQTPDEVIALGTQLVEAILAMHSQKIILRELTPASILIRPDGSLLLTDLELCKLGGESPTVRLCHLRTNIYCAPELNQPKIDETVDSYCWGKIFMYLATGKKPPESVAVRDPALSRYPTGIQDLLVSATSPCYRDRPSAAKILGVLQSFDREVRS